ncbi:MAG: GAF domain-containing protein [Chloroflexota bacterium]
MNAESLRVLLIEDDPGDTRLIQEELANAVDAPFDLECADRLSTGLERLSAGGIALVLLDLVLPDDQGMDAFTQVHARAPEVPIIVLTGLDNEKLAVEVMQQGAQDYLFKGQIDGNQLIRAMRYAIERQRAEKELRETRNYLENLLDYASAPIIVWDPASRITRFNHAFERLTGYTAEEVIGQELSILFPEVSRDDSLNKIARTSSGEYWESVEIPILRKDGEVRLALWNSANVYAEDGATLLATIAQGVDITERQRAEVSLMRRTLELSALYSIGRSALQSLDLGEILDTSLDKLLEAMEIEAGAVYLVDEDATFRLHIHKGVSAELGRNITFIVEDKILQTAIEQKLVLVDVAGHLSAERISLIAKEGLQSMAVVPLVAKERVLGLLCLASRKPHVFSQEQVDFLASLGQQLGSAMENAQLYEQSQGQARDLALLHEVEQLLATTLEEEVIFREIASRCVEVFDVDSCLVRLVENSNIVVKEAYFRVPQDREKVMRLLEESPLHVGEGIAGQVIQTGEAAMSGEESVESLTLPPYAKYLLNRHWLVVPMKAKGRVIGVLTLMTGEAGLRFTERDCRLAQGVANQTAVAIENARLFGETRQARDAVLNMLEDLEETAKQLRIKSERLAVLNELDRVISSSFDLEETYLTFVELAARLISFDRTSIILLDATGENWNVVSFWSRVGSDFPVGAQFPVKDSAMEPLLASRQAWLGDDLGVRGEFLEDEFLRPNGLRSRVMLPLIIRDRMIGALTFGSNQPGAYSERDLEVLTPLADQMAIAVENARLYAAQQRHAAQLKIISEVGRTIASILDQQELLRQVVTILAESFGYHYANILLVDTATGEIVLKAQAGQVGMALEGYRLKIGENGITGWVAGSGQPLLVNDVARGPHYKFVEALKDTRSELAVPILVKGKMVGVLDVQSIKLNAFDEEDLFTLQALAEQTAVALDNAQLYEMERQARHVAEALHDSTASLAGSLDLDQVLDRILDEVQRVIPHDAANIALVDGDFGRLVRWRGYERLGMGAGAPGPDFRISDTPYYRYMAETGQPKVVEDTAVDPQWIQYPGLEWLRSYMGGPIIVREKLIGFLNLDSATPGFFELGHSRLLQTFAQQVGVAIENARLYQEVLASEQEYRTLVENATEWIWTLDIEGRFTFFNKQAEIASGYKAEDWIGKDFSPLIVPDDLSRIQPIFQATLSGEVQSYDVCIYRADGNLLYLAVNTAPLYHEGQVIGTISFGRDVTAQKEAEAALQRRMTELTALFEVSTALRGAETLEAMLPIILSKTIEVAQADTGALFRMDEKTHEMIAHAAQGRLEKLKGLRLAPSESICGYVAQTCTPYPFDNLASDPHTGERVQPLVQGVRGGICIPLLTSEQLVGTLIVGSDGPRVFSDDEIRLLMAIADMAAAAIRRAGLFEELQHRVNELSTLFDVGKMVTASLRIEDVLDYIVHATTQVVHAEGCYLLLWDESEEQLVLRAVVGFPAANVGRVKYRPDEGLAGWVFLEGQTVNVIDLGGDPRWKREPQSEAALPSAKALNALVVSLKMADKTLGVLGVVNKIGASAFSIDDESLLTTLAGQAAISIENARLYEDVRNISIATIRSLAAAIDARDPYTHGHSEGVTRLAVQLARQLGWNGADLEAIEFAALLHDIGKIAVPDAILRKTEPLTAEDWDIIRRHPYFSAKIVEPMESLQRIVPWIYHHHERWDGNGYPDGLKGEDIPLGARIIVIADAFDAMATDRPYRKGLFKTKALAEIKLCSGSQFDPQLAKTFLKLITKKKT